MIIKYVWIISKPWLLTTIPHHQEAGCLGKITAVFRSSLFRCVHRRDNPTWSNLSIHARDYSHSVPYQKLGKSWYSPVGRSGDYWILDDLGQFPPCQWRSGACELPTPWWKDHPTVTYPHPSPLSMNMYGSDSASVTKERPLLSLTFNVKYSKAYHWWLSS